MAISPERQEELRKIAKDRVADLIENPEGYGPDTEKEVAKPRGAHLHRPPRRPLLDQQQRSEVLRRALTNR